MRALRAAVGDGEEPEVDADRDAGFRTLFDSAYAPMVRLAFVLVSNRAEAEEIVQEAYADVFRRWHAVLNPAGYLRTAVINGSRRTVRRRIQRDEIHQRIGPHRVGEQSSDEYLLDVLEQLPERQRTAVMLAYYGDLTSVEIAEALGCATGTAKSLVHRGMRRLRKELAHD